MLISYQSTGFGNLFLKNNIVKYRAVKFLMTARQVDSGMAVISLRIIYFKSDSGVDLLL